MKLFRGKNNRKLVSAVLVFLLASRSITPGPAAEVDAGLSAELKIDAPKSQASSRPSRFCKLTSRRWAYGMPYVRENLNPVANPNPRPEPQPLRAHPYDLALNGSGTKVYIGLQGTELQPGSEVAVLDVATRKTLKRIALKLPDAAAPPASSPYRLIMHPAGRYLFVTTRFSNFSSIIDTDQDQVVAEFPTDFYCQDLEFDKPGRMAYIANRYLDQVFVADILMGTQAPRLQNGNAGAPPAKNENEIAAAMQLLGGLDDRAFLENPAATGIHQTLARNCGMAGCHAEPAGGFVAGADVLESFLSTIPHIIPGDSKQSRLLRAVTRTLDGGYADKLPIKQSHADGVVVFKNPQRDRDYQTLAQWIDASAPGPGIAVGNPRSKPKVCVLSTDDRYLFVGNTGTQDISIVDTKLKQEVGAIYLQNVVNDAKIYHSPATGHDYLLVATEGIGFGVSKERDPYGGESWERSNPAAHYSVWRNLETAQILPKNEQEVLGPFDATDGTASIKFRDIQNDLIVIDISALEIPEAPPANGLRYLLLVNKYEAHRNWVRYTSDTAESTYGDIKGDIPPDLMRVVGAFPEKMALIDDQLFVSMQASNQVQQLRIDPTAADPSNYLMPVAVYPTGLQPIGIVAGPRGTIAEGKLFVANFLGGSISLIDVPNKTVEEIVVDSSVTRFPVPATNAERGEILAHTAVFSSDGDTSCFHCHYLDMGDGRPWGVSQVVGQEYLSPDDHAGQLVIGGTMGVPQMRGLFEIQPFFFEGVISAFEPRSMIMEHAPAEDFAGPTPQGDFTGLKANYLLAGVGDIQSSMETAANRQATQAALEERRDEMFRQQSLRLFGKSFVLRDFQRFVGEWQIHEPRLLPNPYDPEHSSIQRGKQLFEDQLVGCVSCHPAPSFARKDFVDNQRQAFASTTLFTARDGAFTLIGMNRLDFINGYQRDLEPWDIGRAEETEGHFTSFALRGIWDRPPVFLHSGIARSLHEVLAAPGHLSLRRFKYEPLLGGIPERPGKKEVGFNMTLLAADRNPKHVKMHLKSGAKIGFDAHGGTSHLTALQIDDLVNFLNSLN